MKATWRVAFVIVVLTAFCLAGSGWAGDAAIDSELARQYFFEAEQLCALDGGALWGMPLYGPMLFVDPGSRLVVANEADRAGVLTPANGIATGILPQEVNMANTATEWNGERWTMIIWPLPEDREARSVLMVHELWHRIQNDIGFSGSMPGNAHLDTPAGRLWMQLEWRALDAALAHTGDERKTAIEDALVFRAHRRSLFPKAAKDEHALEMNEGLAEYAGVRVGIDSDSGRLRFAENELEQAPTKQSFVRSFAYASGPAYGLLLDAAGVDWRKELTADDDLGDLTRAAYEIEPPDNIEATAMWKAAHYGGDSIRTSEDIRESERQATISAYKAKLIEGPVLHIPLQQMNMSFDPRTVQPLGDDGTVYPSIRVSDVWGILEVTKGGALMSSDFMTITVPLPGGVGADPLNGDGWSLELAEGWHVRPGERRGDYTVVGP